MKKNRLNPALIGAVYGSYRNQHRIINELNIRLSTAASEEEWISIYKERSETMRVAFDVNIETWSLLNEVLSDKGKMNYDYAEAFFHEDMDQSHENETDVFFSCRLLNVLADYYRNENDVMRLLPVLNKLGQKYVATSTMYVGENYLKALDCYREILSYKDNYNLFPSISIRKIFFDAYYYLCCIMPIIETENTMPLSQALDYLLEVLSFYNSPMVQKIDGNSEDIRKSLNTIKENWLFIEYKIDQADSETRSAFIKVAHDVYRDSLSRFGDINKLPVSTVISYQHALILEGSTSYIDAVNYMVDYYERRRAYYLSSHTENIFDRDEFYFETRIPVALIKWLDKIDILSDMRTTLRHKLLNGLNDYYMQLSNNRIFSHIIYESACDWCFFAIKYIHGYREKENFLITMLVNRQPQTFFNAYLNAELAVNITEALYAHTPILLTSVENCLKAYGRPNSKEDVIEFIRKSALFHDIGINLVSKIEGIQYRTLFDQEMDVIKLHPTLVNDILEGGLAIYRDPIIGHHKYFDQSAGYPEDVDMTNSQLRIVCDILAVCDTLNSATDYLGRTYKQPKDFSIILSELITLSGTRYNTNVVNLFLDDMDLACKVDALISANREKKYYEYFIKYFEKPAE